MKRNISRGYFAIITIIFVLCFTNNATSRILKEGPQVLCFFSKVDESDQPYAIYIPKNYDDSKKYPLVVFLHGAMSNHRLGLRRVFGQGNIQGKEFMTPGFVPEETDLEATRYFPKLKDVEYIVIAPYARGTAGYQGIPEVDVYEMIDDVKNRFMIDEDRVYLTGLSMGGGGTLWLGLSRPDIWAAIAPVCPAPQKGTDELAGNALNLSVHLFVGDRDFLHETTLDWKKKFETSAKKLEYIEYPGIHHNSWEYAYKDGFIFKWFSQFERDLFPKRVLFKSRWYKYNKAYWVRLDKLSPGTLATIHAVFKGKNSIEISTTALDAFTLKLMGHPMFQPDNKIRIKIDGKTFTVKSNGEVSFSKDKNEWTNKKSIPCTKCKKPGAEGPLVAPLSHNHVYVFGTKGDPKPEEQSARQAMAAEAADWSVDRGMMGRILIYPRYVADTQIRQSDYETSNLVLFGTRETNGVIDKFADRLPLHLNNDAVSEYGLVYVYPIDGKYFLINSGLPWWTPPSKKSDPGIMGGGGIRVNPKTDPLKELQDFILFKGTPDNVISQGYFKNNWQLPVEELEKLKASGVVSIIEKPSIIE